MRDYNSVQYRSPKQKDKISDHPLLNGSPPVSNLVEQDSAHDNSKVSTSTATSTVTPQTPRAPSPFQSGSPPVPVAVRTAGAPASPNVTTSLSPTDALALRREGPEAYIQKLRQALEASNHQAESRQAAIAKSDAVIVELRSTVRQLKRQLEKQSTAATASVDESSRDAVVGELQVQLDRAHAQILTADMVRKELEDTLEAEQYTWELRVQDQERTIAELQSLADALQHDLDTCRSDWKDAEVSWNAELQKLRDELASASTAPDSEWKERVISLQNERTELQSCLDEALKELEAVDAELQTDNTAQLRKENERLQALLEKSGPEAVMEPLQHLYRWLMEKDGKGEEKWKQYQTPQELLDAIKGELEEKIGGSDKAVHELESQISVYRGDLQAREESSAELRASLKEAVALLKPLQDAAAKADREKAKLSDQLEKAKSASDTSYADIRKYKSLLNDKDDEIDTLKQEIESLELQLSKAKLVAATNVVSQHNRSIESSAGSSAIASQDSISRAREELRAKRQTEKTLKQLLKDAQTRFHTLHQQNQQVEAMNSELQGRLRHAEDSIDQQSAEPDSVDLQALQTTIQERENKIRQLESEVSVLRGELAERDIELRNLQNELHEARAIVEKGGSPEKMHMAEKRVRQLEQELDEKNKIVAAKREAERALNKSLKDALGLIKPLQTHLEDAELEKKEMAEELLHLKLQVRSGGSNAGSSAAGIPSNINVETVRELEITVQELERENSQLQDALEEMSQSLNASHVSGGNAMGQSSSAASNKNEARLREEIVELKSRYEVTQGRLEDAFVENHTLVEALHKREHEETDLMKEVKALRAKLQTSEAELENAKFIATTALVKVEELTMANVEQLSLHSNDHESLYRAKAKEVDQEMKSAGRHRSEAVGYR